MNRVYRGWIFSTEDKKNGLFRAVKDNEIIIGRVDEIMKEIDERALADWR